MGWLFPYEDASHIKTAKQRQDWLVKQLFTTPRERDGKRIFDHVDGMHSPSAGEHFIMYRRTEIDIATNQVINEDKHLLCVLVKGGGNGTLGYKDMCEEMGPGMAITSESFLLKLESWKPLRPLSQIPEGSEHNAERWAREFRDGCYRKIMKRKTLNMLRPGVPQWVRLPSEIKFSNGDTFTEMMAVRDGRSIKFKHPRSPYTYKLSKYIQDKMEFIASPSYQQVPA